MKKIKKLNVVLAICSVALAIFFLYLGSVFKIEQKLSYSEEGNIDYKVYLKSNDDFNAPYLGKGRKYIASLIDHINIDYNYRFKGDKDMDYTCKYYILASAAVKDGGADGKTIYEKEKYLLNDKTKSVSGREIALAESIDLDYGEYNKIIENFTNKYSLSGNNSMLNLSMKIELTANGGGFSSPINDTSSLELSVPLTDRTVAIDVVYKEIDEKKEKIEISPNKVWNAIFFIIGLAFAAYAVRMILILLKHYIKVKSEQSIYEKRKADILGHYGRVISNVDEIKDISSLSFIDVDDFVDLINIRDCLDKPILFSEAEGGQEIAWFVVVDNENAYRYILDGQEGE